MEATIQGRAAVTVQRWRAMYGRCHNGEYEKLEDMIAEEMRLLVAEMLSEAEGEAPVRCGPCDPAIKNLVDETLKDLGRSRMADIMSGLEESQALRSLIEKERSR